MYFFVYTILLTCQLYTMKAIFTLNPTLSVFEVTALKATISFTIIAAMFNTQLKTIMCQV